MTFQLLEQQLRGDLETLPKSQRIEGLLLSPKLTLLTLFSYNRTNTRRGILKKLDFSQWWVWKIAVCFWPHKITSFRQKKGRQRYQNFIRGGCYKLTCTNSGNHQHGASNVHVIDDGDDWRRRFWSGPDLIWHWMERECGNQRRRRNWDRRDGSHSVKLAGKAM